MRTAKYYIYRNLHTGTFSVKYRGKVIAHPTDVIVYGADFRVSQKGRAKVLAERKKYVHAYVVANIWKDISEEPESAPKSPLVEVLYNPYQYKSFTNSATGEPQGATNLALLKDGKVYVRDYGEGL